MKGLVIAEAPPLVLTSFGNGWAYELAHSDGRSVFVQDADATLLREEYGALRDLSALWSIYEGVASTFEERGR